MRRFRVERQALARLVHPGIAAILDGGTLEDGRPYLVLQYVDGVPITDYCAGRQLSLEDRLALFLQVAHAVQFAHGQLVIHRDIKPSNILVQADGRPRLLDFGIAKLQDPEVSGSLAVETRPEVRVLTPDHAAPEQLRGEPAGTATDVYGLGVLLFELLAGRPPFTTAHRSAAELERAILEQPAPAPSTLAPPPLDRRRIRGDLDRIVQVALRKEPDRRYTSAGQLAEDVERFLAGLPVRAQADTLGYRARKFVSRNRGFVTAGAVGLVLVLGFGITSALQARRLAQERDRAERERAAAEDVVQILTDLFEQANPDKVPGGDTLRVSALLDQAERRVEQMNEEPARQAWLLRAVGRMHAARGQYPRAVQMLRRSVEQQRQVAGPDDIEAARTYHELAQVVSAYRGNAAARPMLDTSYAEIHRLLGDDHVDTRTALQNLVLATTDRAVQDSLLQRLVALERDHPLVDSLGIAAMLSMQGGRRFTAAQYPEAVALFQASLDILDAIRGPRDPARITVTNNLSVALGATGQYARAESLQRDVLTAVRDLKSAPDAVGGSLQRLALTLTRRGRLEEAERLQREAVTSLAQGLAPENPAVDDARRNLALI
ncbi:MAG TPA: serine/threonine-protein kinase, partial [Gemmatimonadales bacterium]|nr:serine/threonine-protein kinase [Gemmatimonadales bacterium]